MSKLLEKNSINKTYHELRPSKRLTQVLSSE